MKKINRMMSSWCYESRKHKNLL